MKETVTAFKAEGKLLYLIHRGDPSTHYVPIINWLKYLKVRLNTPKLCKIFNTINEAEQAALA